MRTLARPCQVLLALALLAGAVACADKTPRFPHAIATPAAPTTLPAVTLVGPGGKPFTLASLAGKWVWLYFGYTNCPDVCPMAMDYMGGEYKKLKHPAAVQVVFVSVDPQRDDPKKLEAFAHYHDPHFIGVTGSRAAIDALTHALNASYVIDKPEKPGGSYAVSHTNMVFLLDPDGKQVASYVPGSNPGDLAADTDALTQPQGASR